MLGPTYLDGLTKEVPALHKFEWRHQLYTTSGETKFKIKYYGQLHKAYPNLIVGTDFAPLLIYAVALSTEEEILLFDGCRHGYNAIFCDTYTHEQINSRPTDTFYKGKIGNDNFEVVISIYYQCSYETELAGEIDEKGFVEIMNDRKLAFEEIKRNGFDVIQILLTNIQGQTIEAVSEELA